jgi:HPt (histidine-containing phosphotransfer) domain-containing protein
MTPSARPHALDHDPASPAVNHADGVARLMGDGALFARVLARFRKEYRHAADSIRGALAAGDVQLALRLAHTLKGAAGMIEAVPLREEARALEQELRHGAGDPLHGPEHEPERRLARLQRALDRVLRELDAADGMPHDASPSHAPAAQTAAQHRDESVTPQLRALLEDGNGDAVDLVQDAAASLTRELGEECYGHIAAAIEVFDFEGALALLNR